MSDMSSVIGSFSTGTYVVTRTTAASTYGTDGRLVPASTTTFSAAMCVQPLTKRQLQRLPEGMRTKELRSVWSPVELKTQGSGQDPDVIAIDGFNWQVGEMADWNALGRYWEVFVEKVGH